MRLSLVMLPSLIMPFEMVSCDGLRSLNFGGVFVWFQRGEIARERLEKEHEKNMKTLKDDT